MNEYWFRVNALYQPDDPSGSNSLPPAKQLVLYRVYDDFYNFQVTLLNTFPVEAGRDPGADGEEPKRILPYMPGPAAQVDDKVTAMRKEELDTYVTQLCSLWEFGAEHILRHKLIRDFFTPKAGDMEEDVEPTTQLLDGRSNRQASSQDDQEEVRKSFEGLNVQDETNGNRFSDGSNYEEEAGYPRDNAGNAYQRNVTSPTQSRATNRPEHSEPRPYSPYTSSAARTQSPLPQSNGAGTSGRNYSAEAAIARSTSGYNQPRNDYEQVVTYTSQRRPSDDSPRSFTSNPSQPPSTTSTSMGMSRVTSNANSPPISASNPNTSFVKIKIFDRWTQDLIAMRVNPRIVLAQLLDKVRGRLGQDVHQLSYRNDILDRFIYLEDDRALKEWLQETTKPQSTIKPVLFAD